MLSGVVFVLFQAAFREKKYVLREFSFQADRSGSGGGLDVQIEVASNELKQVLE